MSHATVGIGEFARWTHLSIKALRHYDAVGVLRPMSVDPVTGYRRYGVGQVRDAHVIRRLRELGVPVSDIADVLAAREADRATLLSAHADRVEREIARATDALTSLRRLMSASSGTLTTTVVDVPDLVAAASTATVAVTEIDAWSRSTFDRLTAEVDGPAGVSGSLFDSAFFATGRGVVTAFVALGTGASCPTPTAIAGGRYVAVVHEGPYVDLDLSYAALGAAVAGRHRIGSGPLREHYLDGPGEVTDPADLRTQVLWPLVGAAT